MMLSQLSDEVKSDIVQKTALYRHDKFELIKNPFKEKDGKLVL